MKMTTRLMRPLVFLAAVLLTMLPSVAAAQVVADAGDDLFLECSSTTGTPATLDGTGSSIGADVTYEWTALGIVFDDPTSLTPTGDFPPGTTTVTLTVTQTDPISMAVVATAVDTVMVTVSDTTPPVIIVDANKTSLWPPNHKLHNIEVGVVATDACDPNPVVLLESISSNEPDDSTGDGNTTEDIQGADVGTDDREFMLRSERRGPCTGRVYTAEYSATDASGNSSTGALQISVPHDKGKGKKVGQGKACDGNAGGGSSSKPPKPEKVKGPKN
jgi:hypothetical protein